MSIQPDIELVLPHGWCWRRRDGSPLSLGPEGSSAAFQIASPTAAPEWRKFDDLRPVAGFFAEESGFGQVVCTDAGTSAYGRFAKAECVSDDELDLCVWYLVPEIFDPLVVTWNAEAPSDDSKVARELALSLRPGLFSQALAHAIEGAKETFVNRGFVEPVALMVAQSPAEARSVPLSDVPPRLIPEVCRHERERAGARIVVRVGMEEPNGKDAPLVTVSAESSSRRKKFVLRRDGRGCITREIDATKDVLGAFS
jgi:hypothetical protein